MGLVRAQAQLPVGGIHYPAGLDGIRGASLPAPGIYFRDDNLFYYGTSGTLPDLKSFVYLQAPQVTWMTGCKIFGADYGMDAMIPIIDNDTTWNEVIEFPSGVKATVSMGGSHFGLGDIKIEPLLLSWRLKHFDVSAAYALWVPSGDYSDSSPLNLGDGLWTHMLTLGSVWYPDADKSWAVSVLNHYEFNCQVPGVQNITLAGGGVEGIPENIACSTYTLEWGISKTMCHVLDAGLAGYFQQQFTEQTAATTVFNNPKVAGVGPEIQAQFPNLGLTISARYAYEFVAVNRPRGHNVDLMLAMGF